MSTMFELKDKITFYKAPRVLAMDFNEIQYITVFGLSLSPAAFFSSLSSPRYVPASVV